MLYASENRCSQTESIDRTLQERKENDGENQGNRITQKPSRAHVNARMKGSKA